MEEEEQEEEDEDPAAASKQQQDAASDRTRPRADKHAMNQASRQSGNDDIKRACPDPARHLVELSWTAVHGFALGRGGPKTAPCNIGEELPTTAQEASLTSS